MIQVYAVKSRENNWENLTTFFDFPVEIIKIIKQQS
jgi:transposase-like protein